MIKSLEHWPTFLDEGRGTASGDSEGVGSPRWLGFGSD
jgi:hypothetical protein